MVPALLKLDGEVKILDNGSMLYVFPQLQRVTAPSKSEQTAKAMYTSFKSAMERNNQPGAFFSHSSLVLKIHSMVWSSPAGPFSPKHR